jgi:hypothetical protein|tara:strand:- start:113 stop:508 length:396 start_codon:yes stop_codon:yes gene_type:complete
MWFYVCNLEKLLFSCSISTQTGFLFFQKKKRLLVTNKQIVHCNEKGPQANTNANTAAKIAGHVGHFNELKGITKSLLKGQTNFIIHYEGAPSIEMFCEYREELLETIQQMYWIDISKQNKEALKLSVYGIS